MFRYRYRFFSETLRWKWFPIPELHLGTSEKRGRKPQVGGREPSGSVSVVSRAISQSHICWSDGEVSDPWGWITDRNYSQTTCPSIPSFCSVSPRGYTSWFTGTSTSSLFSGTFTPSCTWLHGAGLSRKTEAERASFLNLIFWDPRAVSWFPTGCVPVAAVNTLLCASRFL